MKRRTTKRPAQAKTKTTRPSATKKKSTPKRAPPPTRRDVEPELRAQELIYDAWETPSANRRAELAREAIGIWPDCADAYNLLADEADELSEKIALFHQAIESGERAIGARAFVDEVGHFWGILETRPYMRARAGLAGCLHQRGDCAAAAAHLRELLRLNPDDNQGLRCLLQTCLLELQRHDELSALLDRYADDSAAWHYAIALLGFRREGDCARTRKLLQNAVRANRYVPAMLVAKKRPRQLPDYIGIGDKREALVYVDGNLAVWIQTPGALEWLARPR